MKVVVTFILFMTLMVMPIVGKNTFSSNFHWPSNGDKVTKTHYEYVELDADTLLWDFSSVVATDSSHVMQWLNVGDSILVKKELGNQLSFIIKSDSIAIGR